jgi:hypothetical protein
VDRHAEHPGEFVTVAAIVPHENSEMNDVPGGEEYGDPRSVPMAADGLAFAV